MTSYERHHATSAASHRCGNFALEVLAALCTLRYSPCVAPGEPLNHFGHGGRRGASFELHFLVEKIMGTNIRLPAETGLPLLGLTLTAYGSLAAFSHCRRSWGIDIVSFNAKIFLLAFGLILFLPGRPGTRIEPQKSQSLESSGY